MQGIITFPFLKLCHALNILCTNFQCTTSRSKISFTFITQLGKLERCSTLFSHSTAGIYLCHSSLACSFQLPMLLTWVTNCSIFASVATEVQYFSTIFTSRCICEAINILLDTSMSIINTILKKMLFRYLSLFSESITMKK